MKDVMKKRVVGATVLVILGIALPLLLARCMQGGGDGDTDAMRVYEVAPDGQAKPASAEGDATPAQVDAKTNSGGPDEPQRPAPTAASEQAAPDMPEAVSPASVGESRPSAASEAEPEPAAAEEPSEPAGATAEAAAPAAPASSSGSLRQKASFSGGYVVQVASFRDEASAEKVARELNSEFKAFYRAGDVNGTTYYRVRVGPFENEAAANAAAAQLKRAGRATLVRRAE
ncbi:SPOR domain-containing protein [Salinisphaera sp. S4-8]|uniref:SPOR domain-containing protein n=1 Tax=Salinisphaera sp. S4-8 TaxID=633357 RepID=UPI00333FA07A